MRSFQNRLSEFDARGIRLAAISVDPPEVTRRHCGKWGFSFTFLADTNATVIRQYEVLHAGAGPHGTDVARPAEFLIDSTGTVRWVNLTESIAVRARPDQVLKAVEELNRVAR